MRESSKDDEDDQNTVAGIGPTIQDPLSGSLLGFSQELIEHHPSHEDAKVLWTIYAENVEPLCKVLHIPTTAIMVEKASRHPAKVSKAHECLMFAIYHCVVFSMTEDDCTAQFGSLRTALLSRYEYAVRQALINASWLQSTAMPVMQANVLYLTAIRNRMDPHTFWILTGVAIRIMQRMGLHRDGESLGLPPFEIQMKRRLFWHLLPIEGYAGQISGTGISLAPNSWDTKQPFNIDDDELYPGMKEQPREQRGAPQMLFCLTRTELSNLYNRTGVRISDSGATTLQSDAELERLIDDIENVIETKYLRYCDIVDPLHFLTLDVARSAVTRSQTTDPNASSNEARNPRSTDKLRSRKTKTL